MRRFDKQKLKEKRKPRVKGFLLLFFVSYAKSYTVLL